MCPVHYEGVSPLHKALLLYPGLQRNDAAGADLVLYEKDVIARFLVCKLIKKQLCSLESAATQYLLKHISHLLWADNHICCR
jgi:hypothetical protein